MESLRQLGEDEVVRRLVSDLASGDQLLVGPGDDCAVVDGGDADSYQLLKTDCIVSGVHYEIGENPERVGWKAVARVVSDFAAMGGIPKQLLVTIAVSPEQTMRYLKQLYSGMQRCATVYGATICGGETSSVPAGSAEVISIAGTGLVFKKQLATRSGGKPGDVVFVTGQLGGSISGKHLDFTPRVDEARWLTEHYSVHAMMDLSDGVAKDLPRMALASGCGMKIFSDKVPMNQGCDLAAALEDGEDYELLFALSPDDSQELIAQWRIAFPELQLTAIGELCHISEGENRQSSGWDHFSGKSDEV